VQVRFFAAGIFEDPASNLHRAEDLVLSPHIHRWVEVGMNRASTVGGRTADAGDWISVLGEVPLFAGLSRRHLNKVAGVTTVRRFHNKTAIVREGENAEALYVVLDGAVSVRRRGLPDLSFGMGSVFGEMSLLDKGPRSATVVAEGPVACLVIPQPRFLKMLRTEPAIALALLRELAARLRAVQATSL
jgi:CRP/FNR family transcriptional regulator, cyclic AMP receptor protein